MKKSKFSPIQIAKILKEYDNGKTAIEISREHGVSKAAFYKWRERYSGMSGKELKRLKEFSGGFTNIEIDPGLVGDKVTAFTIDKDGKRQEIDQAIAPDNTTTVLRIHNSDIVERRIIIVVEQATGGTDNKSTANLKVSISAFKVTIAAPIIEHSAKHAEKR